jgi:hypothetical protein
LRWAGNFVSAFSYAQRTSKGVEKLAAAEQKFAETMPPIEALRAWLLLFVDAVTTKQIIAPALNALVSVSRGNEMKQFSFRS